MECCLQFRIFEFEQLWRIPVLLDNMQGQVSCKLGGSFFVAWLKRDALYNNREKSLDLDSNVSFVKTCKMQSCSVDNLPFLLCSFEHYTAAELSSTTERSNLDERPF